MFPVKNDGKSKVVPAIRQKKIPLQQVVNIMYIIIVQLAACRPHLAGDYL
jgi:hypothetical protein